MSFTNGALRKFITWHRIEIWCQKNWVDHDKSTNLWKGYEFLVAEFVFQFIHYYVDRSNHSSIFYKMNPQIFHVRRIFGNTFLDTKERFHIHKNIIRSKLRFGIINPLTKSLAKYFNDWNDIVDIWKSCFSKNYNIIRKWHVRDVHI